MMLIDAYAAACSDKVVELIFERD